MEIEEQLQQEEKVKQKFSQYKMSYRARVSHGLYGENSSSNINILHIPGTPSE